MVNEEGAPYIPSVSIPLVRLLIATPLCGPHCLTVCTFSLSGAGSLVWMATFFLVLSFSWLGTDVLLWGAGNCLQRNWSHVSAGSSEPVHVVSLTHDMLDQPHVPTPSLPVPCTGAIFLMVQVGSS